MTCLLKRHIAHALILALGCGCFLEADAQGKAKPFKGNLTEVIGDSKQGFITQKITTPEHVDNLLKGFKELGVTGIRVPIFAHGLAPNEPILELFVTKAKKAGFKIYANPAITCGGALIASDIVEQSEENMQGKTPPKKTLNDDKMTKKLIFTIQSFSKKYECDWISPFNEDGKPDKHWSVKQTNTIYSTLKGRVNGAKLVGPDAWGLKSGVKILQQTEILDHIDVATNHNLGFDHELWPKFIALAKKKRLPVWDSEANHHDKEENGTRINAAIDAGVDGIVLYDSWRLINMEKGTLRPKGEKIKALYSR